jgi:RecA/RadA recombinase
LFERVGERAGFSLKKAEEICAEARKKLKVQVLTLEELEAEEAKKQRLSTGCRELDGILGGALQPGSSRESAGRSRSVNPNLYSRLHSTPLNSSTLEPGS